MRLIIRISMLLSVGAILFFWLRDFDSSAADPDEAEAYWQWALERTDARAPAHFGEGADVISSYREPWQDPELYGPDALVAGGGQQLHAVLSAPLPRQDIAARGDASLLGPDPYRDLSFHLQRNEWADAGVTVEIEDVRVESFLFDIWKLRSERDEEAIWVIQPPVTLAETGRMSREELEELRRSGARFSTDREFDPTMDLSRAKARGYEATVAVAVQLPAELETGPEVPSRWGELVLAGTARNASLCFHLIHLRGRDGVVLRPQD